MVEQHKSTLRTAHVIHLSFLLGAPNVGLRNGISKLRAYLDFSLKG